MSKKTGFVLNRAGVRELLRSGAMGEIVRSYAHRVATNAGEGFEIYTGTNRVNVSVRAKTDAAKAKNLEDNTLEKAVRRK